MRVEKEDSGLKLIQFLQKKVPLSAKKLKNLIDTNHCKVNGRVERFSTFLVGTGDLVELKIPEEKKHAAIRTLYEDEHFVIIEKPPHETTEKIAQKLKLLCVHRLDIETSGCLILAKNKKIQNAFFDLFKNRDIKKEYAALVDGIPPQSGKIENYIGKRKSYQGQNLMGILDPQLGLYAKTTWKKEASYGDCSLVTCFPETGRTHQIRVHLASIGHPILGDFTYGKKFLSRRHPPRILLHASKLSFKHPVTLNDFTIASPLPKEFSL